MALHADADTLREEAPSRPQPWQDLTRSTADRVEALLNALTLEEKLAQLVGLWVGANPETGDVAPQQSEMATEPVSWERAIQHGLGQLTRPFGTVPVDPEAGARGLAASQREIMAAQRFGIPALVHEECLAGFAAWRATAYPVPPSWGATFDPDLIARMSARIGASMRAAGVHQGLAPVLDVTRDYRWGRVEETISEDPYLVSAIGAAYVRGLESAGIVATLKHFPGYSASRAGRNLAPVSMGPRELADVILPPFEAALRAGARSVMHSYTEIDGVPTAADERLLTDLLRGEWGFEGTVVADYFGVRFLQSLHGVAATAAEAGALALTAGVDVELPSGDAYPALVAAVRAGDLPESLVDRSLRRVLAQKIELGLLDADYAPEPAGPVVLDDTESRQLALRLAREALVLVANDGVLPLAPQRRLAVVGPLADDPYAMLGCYSFPAHVGVRHPDREMGIDIPTVLAELGARAEVHHARGVDVTDPDTSGIEAAVAAAREAEVCIAVVGDRSGLFGRGTSGEGCDASDLRLPGKQQDLLAALLETGTPVVVVVLSGRPYALGEVAQRASAVVWGFFPGQCGAQALAEILTGEIAPSGRLPLSIPAEPGSGPGTYLAPPLGRPSSVTTIDTTPAFWFGHGLSYTRFEWSGADVRDRTWDVAGTATISVQIRNIGSHPGTEVVQLYLHDPVAQVTRPVMRLIGFARIDLEPGQGATVTFEVPADVSAFTGRDLQRIVEPGRAELQLARSAGDVHARLELDLVGEVRTVGHDRELFSTVHTEVS
ncbi:glycoside hydrolase family 3 C-terminal domain-containing protein [Ruania suaedae]|uniref:beta-xylosidase/alpha-l-arabinosidase n=1 Tax=Ruania suaedae TaxID=2897774 RepID=UPI001E588849|nr:glycoside hydrolase family 3 N-terminal domain-containing protein [Ruania suaedae]UFU03486.1 glycoside hydrolase family 3 C-terminal domain-containing protein [Ruania suaedae]